MFKVLKWGVGGAITIDYYLICGLTKLAILKFNVNFWMSLKCFYDDYYYYYYWYFKYMFYGMLEVLFD